MLAGESGQGPPFPVQAGRRRRSWPEYAPYCTAAKPAGNVLWVDPFAETTFLQALSDLGVVEFFVRENPAG
jgi:hypothetical protein